MATIARYLSGKSRPDGKKEIRLRITVSRSARFRAGTGLYISPTRFDNGKIKYPRYATPEAVDLASLETSLKKAEESALRAASNPGATAESVRFAALVALPRESAIQKTASETISATWARFVASRDATQHTKSMYMSLGRAICRYERLSGDRFCSQEFGKSQFRKFIDFYKDERPSFEARPDLYEEYPAETRPGRALPAPVPRGNNTLAHSVKQMRSFFRWCEKEGIRTGNPAMGLEFSKSETYGTPFYLTKAERDLVAAFDMGARTSLARQRDVFVFQCLVGCRVNDLYSFTRGNFSDGFLEYVPHKTKKDRPTVVRVPLSPTAKAILSKYSDDEKPLPLISQQKYNDAIKEVLKICGIDRLVTVLDPVTGDDRRVPIWSVASSHMARRTFIGVLYKQVKDPNLIGALSGHSEGSKAFVRYRNIDDETRSDVVGMLE